MNIKIMLIKFDLIKWAKISKIIKYIFIAEPFANSLSAY